MTDETFSVYVQVSRDGLSEASQAVNALVTIDHAKEGETAGVEVLDARAVTIDGRAVVPVGDVPMVVLSSAVTQAQIDIVTNEFSHACPYCPADHPEWVVSVEDIPKILGRIIGSNVEKESTT